jgi:hypothetical protein
VKDGRGHTGTWGAVGGGAVSYIRSWTRSARRRRRSASGLARLDVHREKIAIQLTNLETAERVLTRVSTTLSARRPRSAVEGKTSLAKQSRGRPPRLAPASQADVKPAREPRAWASVFSPWRLAKPDGNYTRHVLTIEPCRHGSTAPAPRRSDPGARGKLYAISTAPEHLVRSCITPPARVWKRVPGRARKRQGVAP